jgi:hypothetical protein
MNLWINHPRTQNPSATLTFSVYSLIICLGKFLLNGVEIHIMDKAFNFGTVDASLIAAILTPTLLSYVSKKFKPGQQTEEKSE